MNHPRPLPPTVLVIDDDSSFRAFLRTVLEEDGFRVRAAADGAEGLASYRRQSADVVLCDLFMPGKEGVETIREFRRLPGARVVAMSGGSLLTGGADLLRLATRLGAVAALAKPFDRATLRLALDEALRGPWHVPAADV